MSAPLRWPRQQCREPLGALVLAALLAISAARATTHYVDDSAPLAGDGQSWMTAFRHLQDALHLAGQPGNDVTEIRIAQGIYTPDKDEAGLVTPLDRTAVFTLPATIALRGGYRGAYDGSGQNPDDRDLIAFTTRLTGDLLNNDEPVCFSPWPPSFLDNSNHLLVAAVAGGIVEIDGLTVASAFEGYEGGGLRADTGTDVTVRDCRFENHLAAYGSAIRASGATIAIYSTRFAGNQSGFSGQVDLVACASATIEDCVFAQNCRFNDTDCGGLWAMQTPLSCCTTLFEDNAGYAAVLTGCPSATFNTCTFVGGPLDWPKLGAISFCGDTHAVFQNCTVSGMGLNGTSYEDAAINARGATDGDPVVEFEDCTIWGNGNPDLVTSGPSCVRVEHATARFTGCLFANNIAETGGAIYATGQSQVELTDCVLSGNRAGWPQSAKPGGAIAARGASSLRLTNCSIIDNIASGPGGGVFVENTLTVEITGGQCAGNTAGGAGGGMNIAAGAVSISDIGVNGNAALGDGAGLRVVATNAVLSNVTVRENAIDAAPTSNYVQGIGLSVFGGVTADSLVVEDNTGPLNVPTDGGGMCVVLNDGVAALNNCEIRSHTATYGGALAVRFASPAGAPPVQLACSNCTFEDNHATQNGGGLAILSYGGGPWRMLVSESQFLQNTAAGSGGGAHVPVQTPRFVGCTFEGNSALGDGGGLALNLSYYYSQQPHDYLEDCGFVGNTAGARGGGLYFASPDYDAKLRACNFTLNQAIDGGGAFVNMLRTYEWASARIDQMVFIQNSAIRGGGLMLEPTMSTWYVPLVHSSFVENIATSAGGAVYTAGPLCAAITACDFRGNRADTGGAICAATNVGHTAIWNCLLVGNRADLSPSSSGGGLKVLGNARAGISLTTVVDNVALGGGASVSTDSVSSGSFRNSIFWGSATDHFGGTGLANWTGAYSIVAGGWPGVGNLDRDPLFRDTVGPDNVPLTGDEDYRLAHGSPAIDAGDSSYWQSHYPDLADIDDDGDVTEPLPLDLADGPRRIDDPLTPDKGIGPPVVDMGACEFRRGSGDLDCDGDLDFFDIDPFVLALTGEVPYLAQYPDCRWLDADCDANDDVDFFDIDWFVALLVAVNGGR